jgi:hypothetical protein
VSDNSIDADVAAQNRFLCESNGLKYVRPDRPLAMIQHWEFALSLGTGEYVGLFTDKTFLIPEMIPQLIANIENYPAEIISWSGNTYFPLDFADVFGRGYYSRQYCSYDAPVSFDPRDELDRRLSGQQSRNEMAPLDYSRGKVCFGLYSRHLISRICENFGSVIHPFTPDYSSLSLALGSAKSGLDIRFPVIVQLNTDISTGNKMDLSDSEALDYLRTAINHENHLNELPISGLYSSLNNVIAHEYLTHSRLTGGKDEINWELWLPQIYADLTKPGRHWSSIQVKNDQFSKFKTFISQFNFEFIEEWTDGLNSDFHFQISVATRADDYTNSLFFARYVPESILRIYRYLRFHKTNTLHSHFEDVLNVKKQFIDQA